jgi:diguanylate cyclase (GGDEF)-like protein/PAS domain S-box-containing protein
LSKPKRPPGDLPGKPNGLPSGAVGPGCNPSAASLEHVLQTVRSLEQQIAGELSVDAQMPEYLRRQVQRLCSELRDVEWSWTRSEAGAVPRQQERLELLEAVFEQAQQGIVVLDSAGSIQESNDAFLQIVAKPRAECMGRPLTSVVEWAFPEYDDIFASAVHERSWSGRVVLARGDRSERTYLLTLTPLACAQLVRSVAAVFNDVTDLERSHRRLRRLALHDQLTGLPNRRFYRERVRSLIELCRREKATFAVCFIDLDDFKDVNDSLGHTAGDELLVQVARRLRQHVDDDVFVARLGGDEFAMLIPRTDQDPTKTAATADNVLLSLRDPFRVGDTLARVGASLGITEYSVHTTDVEELLENADVAMYSAKSSGRNQVCVFAPEMRKQVERRTQIQQDLRRALRGNEISLRYQPLVDLKTGVLHGCEALARWRTPQGRELLPAEFVPIAESSGLVVALGELVLVEACRQAREWDALGVRPPLLGVNIAPQHLLTRGFVERTAEILEATGAQPEWMMLEIIEDAVTQDVRSAMRAMDELVELGLTLAIDDFGTGRSSFSYLKDFNIHALKIDRSFIADIPANKQTCSIVESMIHLGQGRQLQIVAEGIETAEQYHLLCEMGCDIGQGFHIAHPLRATALECWWDEANC